MTLVRRRRRALEHGEVGPLPSVAPDELILPSRVEPTGPVRAVATWNFLPVERQPDREEPTALCGLARPLEQMARASPGEELWPLQRSGLPE
jgi:hypothetical protein